MDPARRYPFLKSMLEPFEVRRQRTLALCIAAIAVTGQARSFAVATTMARWLGTQLQSAINRFYRLLRNDHLDEQTMVAQWAKTLCRDKTKPLLIAVDWTEWHSGLRMLVAAVVTGRRAIPVAARAFAQRIWRGSQNTRENDFLRLLAAALKQAHLDAILLCDRGFRRVSWLTMIDRHGLSFVVRLMDDVHVQLDGRSVALKDIELRRGRILDLGEVALRADAKHAFRVVGYRKKGASQTWWLATNLTDPPSRILSLYDRRMTIEEQFRDLKGKRFGAKLSWTRFRDPLQLARFVMLLAIALLIWMLTGHHAANKQPTLQLVSKSKGPRQSFVTIGLRLAGLDPPPLRLTDVSLLQWLPAPDLRAIAGSSRGGK